MKLKLNGNEFYRVTSSYGEVDSVHKVPHTGIDIATPTGTKLYSPTDGVIERVVDFHNQNIGKGVIIRTNEGEHVILGHLSDNSFVHVGQHVHVGDYIAKTGNSGFSTGSHLHVGLKDSHGHFINPQKLFNNNDIASTPHTTQIGDAVSDIAPQLNAGEMLQNALSNLSETLSQMSLNVIHAIFNSSTFDLILETICTIFCI